MKTRLKLVAAALVALVVLAGCNLGAKVVVHPDGSGSYSILMTVPNASSHPGRALYAALNSAAAKSNVPLTVRPYTSASGSGATLTYHFLSLADLDAESQRLASSGKGGIGVDVSRDNTGWHFSASTANSLIKPSTSTGDSGSPALRNLANQAITINLTAQLPGAPAVNNAKSVTHTATTTTFTWLMSSNQAGADMQASTTFVGNQANVKLATALTPVASASKSTSTGSGLSGGMVALIAGGAVLVLVLAVGGYFVVRRRRAVPDPEPEPVGSVAGGD